MKQIVFKLSIFFLLLIFCLPTFSQNIEHNLEKYWYYRERFRRQYIIVDDPNLPGTNLVLSRMNGMIIWHDGTTMFNNGNELPSVSTGDALFHHGEYIAVLASEYRLLKDAGQDYSQTLTELYYALYTIERLDLTAESFLRMSVHEPDNYDIKYYNDPKGEDFQFNQKQKIYPSDLNGFFLRNDFDGPKSEDASLNNNYYNALDYNGGFIKSDNGFDNTGIDVGYVSRGLQKEVKMDNYTVESRDMIWGLMYGLALVHKLVDEPTLFANIEGEMMTIDEMNKKITYRIVDYLYNLSKGLPTRACTEWEALTGNCIKCDGEKCSWFAWKFWMCDIEYEHLLTWNLTSPIYGEETKFKNDCFNPINVPEKQGGLVSDHFSYAFAEAADIITDKDYGTLHNSLSLYGRVAFRTYHNISWFFDEDVRFGYISMLSVTNQFAGINAMDYLMFESILLYSEYWNKKIPISFPLIYQVLHGEDADPITYGNVYTLYSELIVAMLDESNDCGIWFIEDNTSNPHLCSDDYWIKCDYTGGATDHSGFRDCLDYMLLHNMYWLNYLNESDKSITEDYPVCYEEQEDYCYGNKNKPATINATNSIYAANTLAENADVTYSAGKEIELGDGFEVIEGAEFEAIVGNKKIIYEYKNFNPACDFSFFGDNYFPEKNTDNNDNECNSYPKVTQEEQQTDTINVCLVANTELKIYPSPTTGILNVNLSENNDFTLRLFNTNGQLVLQNNYYEQSSSKLNLSDYRTGIYVLEITINNTIYTEKIIIQ